MTPRIRIPLAALIALLAVACAQNTVEAPRPAPEPQPVPPAWPQPAPPEPEPAAADELSFEAWLRGYRMEALAAGIPASVVERELSGLTPNPSVVKLDGKQPEFSRPVGEYVQGVTSEARVGQGAQYRDSLSYLGAIEQRYGVPREVVLAVWALESSYGKVQGDMDVVRSLATLAWDGRRRDWAEDELTAALRIIARGEATRSQLKGSWAGAMGQTQFLPSVYLKTAVDGDGDGKRDIWGSTHDALASTANYLAQAGWLSGQGWAWEVTLPPGFDYSLSEGPKEPPSWWQAKGVRRADGASWSGAEANAPMQLILPAGADGPAFLVGPNHFAIRAYNNSTSYALGVGVLADRLAGRPAIAKRWPDEVPLSLYARQQAQRDLAKVGFDPGPADGIIGANTRAALRDWQKARGLPADGYLSPAVIRRLSAEAAGR
ncbi:MAG TPA: lytic murein transglycosylase [Caulobacteraceae bacterium]